MCSTHCTLSYRVLFFPFPTSNNFFQLVCSEITRESAWWIQFWSPWCCLFLWHLKVIRIWLGCYLDFWYRRPCYLLQEVLVPYFFVCECPLSTQCIEECTVWQIQYHFFRPFYSFPQNWVITEVLVCPVHILHEFIVLDNSVRLLYFHICFPVFPPWVYNCCIMDRTYHAHKSFVLSHLHHYVAFPPECRLPPVQALAFPFQVTWNAPVSSHNATGSHISV